MRACFTQQVSGPFASASFHECFYISKVYQYSLAASCTADVLFELRGCLIVPLSLLPSGADWVRQGSREMRCRNRRKGVLPLQARCVTLAHTTRPIKHLTAYGLTKQRRRLPCRGKEGHEDNRTLALTSAARVFIKGCVHLRVEHGTIECWSAVLDSDSGTVCIASSGGCASVSMHAVHQLGGANVSMAAVAKAEVTLAMLSDDAATSTSLMDSSEHAFDESHSPAEWGTVRAPGCICKSVKHLSGRAAW